MPFDTTKLRQPTITVLPQTERDGGPRRIRVEIEIVDRRTPPRRRPSVLWWLLAFLLLALAAHAQPHYDHWQSTDGWHGQTRTEGTTTDFDAYGPHGEQRHCHSYFVGDQRYTTCR
jgi:hypothetical protein